MMQRLIPVSGALATACATAMVATLWLGCDKSKEEDCKKAVANIRLIYGPDLEVGPSPRAAVRSCRGSTSADRVDCYIAAKTIPDLQACGGNLIPQAPAGGGDKAPDIQEDPKQPDVKPDNTPKPPTLIDPVEPGKTEPGKTEPGKTEPAKTEPGKTEPTKGEPGKTEPAKTEPAKTEPAKPNKTEPAGAKPAAKPAADPGKGAPGK